MADIDRLGRRFPSWTPWTEPGRQSRERSGTRRPFYAIELKKRYPKPKGLLVTADETGLTVRAELDEKKYPKGLKVSDAQLATVNMFPHDFHGEWNYTIAPNSKRARKSD